MRRFLPVLLPFAGAIGFAALSELSLRRSHEFLLWSLATMVWILGVFALQAKGKLRGRLTAVAVPAVAMIAISTVMSLLFLDLVAPRRGFIAFFAVILYLFLEHVRREAADDSLEDRLSISEFARMVNIGSLFLVASVGIGVTVFLPVEAWWTVPPVIAVAALWSWHLYLACTERCMRPGARVMLTTLIVLQTYLVALTLPTSMFVGGALVGIVYYLAANLLPIGATEAIPVKLIRRYVMYGGGLLALILATARWV
ncbi:MAG TPA: hypothetical protein VL283_01340 [Candidatus Baltobacteraceae bacterium]|nr:hypothetical protein [Candidatus Baltobacteraceae bacterium]